MIENLRLLAVKQFNSYNLNQDSELQELITVAAEICDAPIAFLSLLDSDTQWFKIVKGLCITSLARKESFCDETVRQKEIIIIPDLRLDTRYAYSQLVIKEPGIRFYAGVPLITHSGLIVGTIGLIDYKPRDLSKHQLMVLKILASQATNVMELKENHDKLEKSRIEASEQRRAIVDAEIRLRSFFESSANFHVLLGKNGEVLDFNKTAYNFIRTVHNVELTRGDMLVKYIEPSFMQTFLEKYKLTLTGQKSSADGSTDYGELGIIYWEAFFEPAFNNENEVIGASYHIRDVTVRKNFENKILSQNRSLVNIAYVQSHEYRGPLSSIMGIMNLIKDDDYQAPIEYLKLLDTAIKKLDDKMQEIVNQVHTNDIDDQDTQIDYWTKKH